MNKFNEFMNQFLDEFTEWRKKKGYKNLTTLIQDSDKRESEKRFWQEIEQFKKERLNNGTVIIN